MIQLIMSTILTKRYIKIHSKRYSPTPICCYFCCWRSIIYLGQTWVHCDIKDDLEFLVWSSCFHFLSTELKICKPHQIYWSLDQTWTLGKIISTESYIACHCSSSCSIFTAGQWKSFICSYVFFLILDCNGTIGG